jgi:hypothetical protein
LFTLSPAGHAVRMKRIGPSSAFLAAFAATTACGGLAGRPGANDGGVEASVSSVDGSISSEGNGASTPCPQLGGVCQPSSVENFSCQNVDGGAYEYRGSIPGLCGTDPSLICCIRPDADGGLPPQLGTDGICGPIVCAAGSTCRRGKDTESCTISCGGLVPDAGCPSCGTITCGEGCLCLDATTNHCGC